MNSFTPKDWVDGPGGNTPITAAELDRIEAGIESADTRLDVLDALGYPRFEFRHSARGRSGAITGNSDSGHPLYPTGAVIPVYAQDMITTPDGLTLPATGATYLQTMLPKAPTRMRQTLKFRASDDYSASLALGVFSTLGVSGNGPAAPLHLSITPLYAENSVFTSLSDYTSIVPVGHLDSTVEFPYPLRCDGVTEYPVDVVIDPVNARAYVTIADFPTFEYAHPLIAQDARYPFWETYLNGAATNLGGFLDISADTRSIPAEIRAAQGATRPRAGTGASTLRPPSTMHPGATWYDRTLGRFVVSDGDRWRRSSDSVIVGNLYSRSEATHSDGQTVYTGSNSVAPARKVAPVGRGWRHTTGVRIAAAAAGEMAVYRGAMRDVVAGDAYTFGVDQVEITAAAARSVRVDVLWYDAAGTNLVAAVGGAPLSCAPGAARTLAPVSLVAPAGAGKALVIPYVTGCAVGDAALFSGFYAAPGTHTAYVRP